MTHSSCRTKTFNESLYFLSQELSQSFTLQFLLLGAGILDKDKLETAIRTLADQLPQLRIRSTSTGWSFDGELPVVCTHTGSPPADLNVDLYKHCSSEAMLEFHLFDTAALLFRVHHSVVDAKGAQLILHALFSLMRDEPATIYSGFDRDDRVVRSLVPARKSTFQRYAFQWPGFSLSRTSAFDFQICLVKLPFKLEGAVAKIALWYSQQFNEPCRVMIPVDLRRHAAVEDSVSNSSLPIYLTVDPGCSWQEIQAQLLHALHKNSELQKNVFESLAALSPAFFLRHLLTASTRKVHRHSRYPISAIISDNGTLEPGNYDTVDFKATELISLPIFAPLAPFCANIIVQTDRTQIAFSIPAHLNGDTIQSNFEDFLSSGHTRHAVQTTPDPAVDQRVLEVVNLWAEILECSPETVTADVKFHQLGGDSLKFLAMLSEISNDLNLSPRSVFISTALDTGGDINIHQLLALMQPFRSTDQTQ